MSAGQAVRSIAIVGAGPGGLYLAISLKLRNPALDVVVHERNRPDDTFGWGVVFSDQTLANLKLNDPETADFFARHIGTRTEEKLTERAQKSGWLRNNDRTGEMSIREVEAYKIHPNVFKEFTAGQGVIHFPTKRGNISEIIQFARLTEQDCPK